jgi:hypothetical protein
VQEPSIQALDSLLRARGLVVPVELLSEIAPAVADMWRRGAQLESAVADLHEGI